MLLQMESRDFENSSSIMCSAMSSYIYFRNATFNIMKCFALENDQEIICSYMIVYLENPMESTEK